MDGLTLEQAECAIKSISIIHALSLGMKFKEKVDLNEKYPVKKFGHLLEPIYQSLFIPVSVPNQQCYQKLFKFDPERNSTANKVPGREGKL